MRPMNSVGQLLSGKPGAVFTVSPDATVFHALVLLAEHDIGALLVVEGEELLGIFSERDYARGVVLRGRSSRAVAVRDLMVTDVISVSPSDSITHCMETMTRHRVRHLPVLEHGQIVGIVTIGDVVKCVITKQTETIEQLESYIQGH